MHPRSTPIGRPEYRVRSSLVSCDWQALKAQLLAQWNRLTDGELDRTGRDFCQIALLVERKYGIRYQMVENYLRNFERTMPLVA